MGYEQEIRSVAVEIIAEIGYEGAFMSIEEYKEQVERLLKENELSFNAYDKEMLFLELNIDQGEEDNDG